MISFYKSNRKAMYGNRNNQKANPALKTRTNHLFLDHLSKASEIGMTHIIGVIFKQMKFFLIFKLSCKALYLARFFHALQLCDIDAKLHAKFYQKRSI